MAANIERELMVQNPTDSISFSFECLNSPACAIAL
jgi:hypothetical protein